MARKKKIEETPELPEIIAEETEETTLDAEISGDVDDNGEPIVTEAEMPPAVPPIGPPHLASASGNSFIRQILDQNFLTYASYVIKDRAIPDVDDGFKPVQRRILWSLFRTDDGRFHKVANIIGHTMQFHPHGDASIGDALVVLANKELFIDRQGNFGNIYTGDCAAAARYIECRLSPLGRAVLYNNDITEFVDSYDGRNLEPVRLPVKIPALLMMGAEGIAVGMSTSIPPHNFCEAIKAQIAILKNESFVLYPDFFQGGLMDISEYDRGRGKIQLRARIEKDGRRLVIREVPGGTNTQTLINSIEKAAEKNKIKIQSISDFTADKVEIEIIPTRGYDPDKAETALYAYTDCQVSFTSNMLVICDNRPQIMTVDQILLRNTRQLLRYLSAELANLLEKLAGRLHERTLERIFIEERIYKRIEKCKARQEVLDAVRNGLAPFAEQIRRDVTDEDITRLLAIPIRRISLFDIQKNLDEIETINGEIETAVGHLKKLNVYAIDYLKGLLKQYGPLFPRRTEITTFGKINLKAAALSNVKVGWDRKGCYVGRNVKSDETITCTQYDRLLCIDRSGTYRVIRIPDKLFVDKLYDFRKFDSTLGFCMVYTDKKSGKCYWKRFQIAKALSDKVYTLCPPGCRIDLLTTRLNATFEVSFAKGDSVEINLWEAPERSARSRGLLIDTRAFSNIRFLTLVDDAEVIFGDPGEDDEDVTENTDFQLDDESEDEGDFGEGWKIPRKEMEPLRELCRDAAAVADAYLADGTLPSASIPPPEAEAEPEETVEDEEEVEEEAVAEVVEIEEVAKPVKPKRGRSKKEPEPIPEPEVEEELEAEEPEPQPKPKKQRGKKTENDDGEDQDSWGMRQMDFGF